MRKMADVTFDSINDNFEEKVNEARKKSWEIFGKKLRIYYPSKAFPTISVTGASCDQNCLYCNKKYLEQMISIKTPERMLTFAQNHEKKGGTGFLISGGFNEQAILPIEPFLDIISKIKETTNLKINLHPGLINRTHAKAIYEAKIDTISFDLVTDNQIIDEILGNGYQGKDYIKTFETMIDVGLTVIPHICLGLYYGTMKGNIEAIDTALKFKQDLIVFLGLIPTKNTPMANTQTINPIEFMKTLTYTRLKQPQVEQSLGCMRVRLPIFEKYAIQAGVNRIAVPKRKTINFAKENYNMDIIRTESCCAISEK
ncbi:MAG: radical SAM protein [Asgard group archaeon]|nr:radical SAM protein [Asgard group archaeon]